MGGPEVIKVLLGPLYTWGPARELSKFGLIGLLDFIKSGLRALYKGSAWTLQIWAYKIAQFHQIGSKGFILRAGQNTPSSHVAQLRHQTIGPAWINRDELFLGPDSYLGPNWAHLLDCAHLVRQSLEGLDQIKKRNKHLAMLRLWPPCGDDLYTSHSNDKIIVSINRPLQAPRLPSKPPTICHNGKLILEQ